MPITINCPDCNKEYRVDDKLAGKKVKCRECGTPITVGGDAPQAASVDMSSMKSGVKRCPSCRTALGANAMFCSACGWSAAPAVGGDDEIGLSDSTPAKKKRKWVREAGNPTLNSIDSIVNLVVWWALLAGVAVWVYHLAKTPQGISFGTLFPLILTLGCLTAIGALMMIAIKITVTKMEFIPRDDTFNRTLLVLFLPLAAGLLVGWPNTDPNLRTGIETLSWILVPALFVYLFRAEKMEWIASVGAGVVTLFLGWLLIANVIVGPMVAPSAYKNMLPDGPWTALATADVPVPESTTKPAAVANAGGPTTPSATAPSAVEPTPSGPQPTPTPSIVSTGGPTNDAHPEATNPGNPENPANPTNPTPGVSRPRNGTTATPGVTAAAPGAYAFLTDVTMDRPEFQGVTAIHSGPTAGGNSYMLLAKPGDTEGMTEVQRWTVSPKLALAGSVDFIDSPTEPASYALNQKGDVLFTVTHSPSEQFHLFTFDNKPTTPIRIETTEPATVVGFLDARVLLRGRSVGMGNMAMWNTATKTKAGVVTAQGLMPGECNVIISPDGHLIASAVHNASGIGICLSNTSSSMAGMFWKRITVTDGPGTVHGLAFSPDNKEVAICVDSDGLRELMAFKVDLAPNQLPYLQRPLGKTVSTSSLIAHAGPRGSMPGLLWLQNGSTLLVDGEDLHDAATGKKIGSLNLPDAEDAALVGNDSILILEHPTPTTSRAVLAKWDMSKIKETVASH